MPSFMHALSITVFQSRATQESSAATTVDVYRPMGIYYLPYGTFVSC